jgi:hypothetical protein
MVGVAVASVSGLLVLWAWWQSKKETADMTAMDAAPPPDAK